MVEIQHTMRQAAHQIEKYMVSTIQQPANPINKIWYHVLQWNTITHKTDIDIDIDTDVLLSFAEIQDIMKQAGSVSCQNLIDTWY